MAIALVSWITAIQSGGGGGGSAHLRSDSCPNGDYSPSYYDGTCGTIPMEDERIPNESAHNSADDQTETTETNKSENSEESIYEWAKEYQLTDANTEQEMRGEDKITRAEMAKIIVSYMDTPFLKRGKEDFNTQENSSTLPPEGRQCSSFTDLNQVNAELQSSIIKACEYGLMGYHADGERPKEKFFPNGEITRAEVATIISRMLR
jgi:hypothetical protein